MKLAVLDKNGQATGREVSLPESMFGVEPNEHVVYLAVKSYLAGLRQGTSKAKERGEISGSTRKLKKQKGTGTARAGSIKSPIFRGGGTVFGPRPRTYVKKLNKKEIQLSKASVLSDKLKNDALAIIEDFSLETPKTKEFVSVLNSVDAKGKVLFVHTGENENVILSARNIAKVLPLNVNDINAYHVLNADKVIFSEGAINQFVK